MKVLLIFVITSLISLNGLCQDNQFTVTINDSIRLKLIKEDFNKNNREIIYWDSTQQAISSIDGKPVYGTDACIPLSELTFAELQINNRKIKLETFGMYDPWEDRDTIIRCEVEQFLGNPLKIRCWFSTGAGSYLVEWTVIGDKSFRTMITYDMKILDIIQIKEYQIYFQH